MNVWDVGAWIVNTLRKLIKTANTEQLNAIKGQGVPVSYILVDTGSPTNNVYETVLSLTGKGRAILTLDYTDGEGQYRGISVIVDGNAVFSRVDPYDDLAGLKDIDFRFNESFEIQLKGKSGSGSYMISVDGIIYLEQ